MPRTVLAAALLAAATILPAAATDRPHQQPGASSSRATASAAQRQAQRQTQVATGVGGRATAAGGAATASGGASYVAGVSGGSVVATDRLQAPSIAGFSAYPTADCVRPVGVGGSGPGAGGLISFGLTDHHCRALARAAMLDRLGHREAAIEALCEIDEARAALKRAGTPCAADRPPAQAFDEVATAALLASAPACTAAAPGESTADRLTRERNCR